MSTLSPDPSQAGEQLEQFARDLEQKAQRYNELHDQLGATSVTERSPGGEVTVTVDANGALTRLDLAARAKGMEPQALSADIMACVRRAQAKLREQVTTLVHDTVGDDQAGANIINQYAERYPDPVAEDDAPDTELPIGRLADEPAEQRTEPRSPRPRPRHDDEDDMGGGSILR